MNEEGEQPALGWLCSCLNVSLPDYSNNGTTRLLHSRTTRLLHHHHNNLTLLLPPLPLLLYSISLLFLPHPATYSFPPSSPSKPKKNFNHLR